MNQTIANALITGHRSLVVSAHEALNANPERYLSEDDLPALGDIYVGDMIIAAHPDGLYCFGLTSPEDEDEQQGFAFTIPYGDLS